ncbi:MAG: hypothetical protein ACXIUM_08960 [Wenzhouxiangella sp.]
MSNPPSSWLKAWDLIDLEWQRIERVLLTALLALVLVGAVLRFGFSALGIAPPPVAGEGIRAIMLWFVMLSASFWLASWCARRPQIAPSLRARIGQVTVYWVAALVCLFLCLAGLRFMALDWQLGSAAPFDLSGWWLLLPLPLLFLIMSLRLIRLSLQQLD